MAPSATSDELFRYPFPKDVPVISLRCISLAKLRQHDSEEIEQLWEACKDSGFFYLDLQTSEEGKELARGAETVYQAGKGFFTANTVAEKSQFKLSPGHLDTG